MSVEEIDKKVKEYKRKLSLMFDSEYRIEKACEDYRKQLDINKSQSTAT